MPAPDSLPSGNRRVTGAEQFYTPPEIAADLVRQALADVPGARARLWLEPAGGTGAFVDAATAAGIRNLRAYDTDPRHPQVTRADFLTVDLPFDRAVCVTNPPFGRNNSLSVRFFNRAAGCCDDILLIVPRSWRKWSVQNRLDRRFGLVADRDLTVDYVDAAGVRSHGTGTLRTCVQHWRRQDELRPLHEVPDRRVVVRCGPAEADAALTMFGYGCGTVRTVFARVPNSTVMFVRLVHPRALEALRAVDYSRFSRHVAYTPALSLPEVNWLLNEYLFGPA